MFTNSLNIIKFKTIAEIKAEAARSYLGLVWWILEPLLYLTVFYTVFSIILQRDRGAGFVFFLLVGLVVWKWFSSSILSGASSIVVNAGLMRQVYLPKYMFVHVSILVNLYKFLITFGLLLLFIAFFGPGMSASWAMIPVILVVQFTVILFLTSLVAAIVPVFPDLKVLVDNGMMLLFFLSGIFFSLDNAPASIKIYLSINPMAVLIDSYRAILLEHSSPDWGALSVIFMISIVGYALALKLIDRLDPIYPKVILR